MGELSLHVSHVLDPKPISVPLTESTTAEDACLYACRQLNISPLTRHLFGLRVPSKNIFLVSAATFDGKPTCTVELRIRFKVPSYVKLRKLDVNAYNYYFHQARRDVLENKVPDIVYEKYKREMVGLGITDMYRVMLEKDIPRETIESEYKKYIPKEVLKKHAFFVKNPIKNTLAMLEKSVHDASYVKAEYLRQLEIIAPEYLSEMYKAVIDQNGKICSIVLKVTSTKINFTMDTKKDEWSLICLIEDLGFISINNDDRTIEISRKNGIPFYLQFNSSDVMFSFIGLLDGYYRLTCKWTFNVCREVYTPSLQKLLAMKCHGPVGGEFSYEKLESKRNNRLGCFILRESESKYNDYYIDVCLKEGSKPTTFKLEKIIGDEFIFNDDLTKYKDIKQLMKAYKDPNGSIYLKECLPPSEYDISPLLLLKSENLKGDLLSDSSDLSLSGETCPICINAKNLQVFKDRKCLKWNKNRKRIKTNGTATKPLPKFKPFLFPDGSLSVAKKSCRNPDGDIGGPWCLIENEESDVIEKEYCDVPFCDDPECMVFTKDQETYTHFTDFNDTLTNLTFGVKLWGPDSFLRASARLVLAILPLPLDGKDIEGAGIGIEILIGNNLTGLRYGNKDSSPDYEPTHGILKSNKYTIFHLSWHAGFVTLNLDGNIKPVFLAEYRNKKNLLSLKRDAFSYYSAQGTDVLWYFPFCKDDFECDVKTTVGGGEFQQYWPMRAKDVSHDLLTYVRAKGHASIIFVPSPTVDFPYLKISFLGEKNYTWIVYREYGGAPEVVLKELQLLDILDYWDWREFSISFFANVMSFYVKKPLGMQLISELKHEVFRKLRWFSVSSMNTIAHWTFYCVPPVWSNPPYSLPPECALDRKEDNYNGTQAITHDGLPCLPWSAKKLIGEDFSETFKSGGGVLSVWNYCRDPRNEKRGTFCYTLSTRPVKTVEKKYCAIRKCKSQQCRMAGTGNDYIGDVNVTRSNRTCAPWNLGNITAVDRFSHRKIWNDSLFADMSSAKAYNHCRNPSRDISGSWCYTTDPKLIMDTCNVRDCDKSEESIIVVASTLHERKVFILPQWKESGMQGGLRFGIKEWNPDFMEGLDILITPKNGSQRLQLQIGAELNEKIRLIYNGEVIVEKPLSHIILAGKWTELWLQVRQAELLLGLEGVPTPLLEWTSSKNSGAENFVPTFLSFGTIAGYPLGVYFKRDECHTENISANNFGIFYPIGLWREEAGTFNNLTIRMRGVGVVGVQFTLLPSTGDYYYLRLDGTKGLIALVRKLGTSAVLLASTSNITRPILTPSSWTEYLITFNETVLTLTTHNGTVVLLRALVDDSPIVLHWFSVSAESSGGWATWSANCAPLDLDGPPRDGGWSQWSKWTCTVTCGGGEGFRTRTCSNPRPNVSGRLCEGPATATGKCNEFPCGDLSPDTMERIREALQRERFGMVLNEGQEKEGSSKITVVVRSLWKVKRGKKIEVAMKHLKSEFSARYLKEFLTLAGQWAFLQSSAIVKLFGIAFTSNVSLVMEYFRLGPLDEYLRKNRTIIKEVDLIEAASNIASALWHLSENDIVHGNIRCRKLMVNTHDENSFTVKLTDPGVGVEYASSEVHWIPVECYTNLNFAKISKEADVWSFGTTLWELFMYGKEFPAEDHMEVMKCYHRGTRLPKPPACTDEIYSLMRECWDIDPHKRKKPQAIMRDINQILYQVYNSRKVHSYAKPSLSKQSSIGASATSLISNETESTVLYGLLGPYNNSTYNSDASSVSSSRRPPDWMSSSQDLLDYDWSNILPSFNISTATTSLDSLNSDMNATESVFELDGNYTVVLQGRIGQGFYGEVYKATMESVGGEDIEPKKVAVKKLKTNKISTCLRDFEREINIMKNLRHPNIVEILGVLREEIYLVMEFVPHGSLQSFLKIYRESLQEKQLLKYALDIAKGMDYLGRKNIVHRDLATRNILVADQNHVKISDFGLAQVVGSDDYYILKTNRELPIKWYALESLKDGKFSVRSDVWSYGVTLCETFNYGEEPQLADVEKKDEGHQQVLIAAIERGSRYPCPVNCQKSVYIRIIYPCWNADPHRRPDFTKLIIEIEDLLKHT